MTPRTILQAAHHAPDPANPDAARIGLERWREAAETLPDGAYATNLATDADGRRILEAVFGNSSFLTGCLLREVANAASLFGQPPEHCVAAELDRMQAPVQAPRDKAAVMAALRQARRRVALVIALADITRLWSLDQVTGALSGFADLAIQSAVAFALQQAVRSGDLSDSASDQEHCGVAVLGMGKLGARELNYSSDVDLILLYDANKVPLLGRRTPRDVFTRFARDVVSILQERTADGFVLRTDLRLRPDPSSTAPAIELEWAATYYESVGQNWERAAMIKARPVAGDRLVGDAFLQRLTPFIWRRHLDFAAIQDIHSIKRQINAFKGGADIALHGHDIKVGRGGIREIEFYAQTQQLIWGGRDPAMRDSTTCGALAALAEAGRIDRNSQTRMSNAYHYLRGVEHRLQMVADQQTQRLPQDDAGIAALACFLGYPASDAFTSDLLATLTTVSTTYGGLFEDSPSLGRPCAAGTGRGSLVFTGAENDPETLETLAEMGFGDPPTVCEAVRGWHRGRYRALRTERARQLLTELMPHLLEALAATVNPDTALARFDAFLERLPAGVQLLSLFQSNPQLLALIARIMGTAPALADQLSRFPLLLDSVLETGFRDPLPDRAGLGQELRHALDRGNDLQDYLEITRRWARDRRFQVGVRIIESWTTVADSTAGRQSLTDHCHTLSDIAEVCVDQLHDRIADLFAEEEGHGRLPGDGLAVVALGKLGARELTFASDLDLVFIHDDVPADTRSNGPKPLPPMVYFTRLGQRIISALTALTGEGRLYEVDMRLRPSGNKGPLVTSLEGFSQYQEESAWTWEHMALTKARVISATPALRLKVAARLQAILQRPRNPEALRHDIVDMRARVAKQFRPRSSWDFKYISGGQQDIDFLIQHLQLRHAAVHKDLAVAEPEHALERIAANGLLPTAAVAEIVQARRLYRELQALLRLTVGESFDETAAPPEIKEALVAIGGSETFEGLQQTVQLTAERMTGLFRMVLQPELTPGPATAFGDATPS